VTDAAGNAGPVYTAAYVLDLVAPTLVVTSSAATLKAGEAATLTFTFSEAPNGFADTDLVAVNGTLSGFTATANPLVYTVVLTPNAGLGGGSAGVTLAPGLYTDIAGNSGGGASSPLITVDTAPPVLTITSSAANLKIGESAVITFSFSEAPVGFTQGDISVGGGTLSGFGLTANPLVYTALFTPTPGTASGSGTVSVLAGKFTDAAGNPAPLAAVTPISYSTLAPSTGAASLELGADNGPLNNDLVTNVALQTISGQLSANLQAGETVEVSLDNGLSWNSAAGATGSTAWNYGPTVLSGSGVLQVRVTDAAGNHGAATSKAYVIDTTAPGATISANAANLKGGDVGTFTITFSEAPAGFTLADLVADGVTLDAASFGVTANPLVYTVQFTPVANRDTPASVSLTAGSYIDQAGNAGLGASSAALTVDARPPSVLITSNAATLKAGETALITFTFSEAPSGFAVGDIVATGGTLSGFTPTANPLVYTAVFTPTPANAGGSASISVASSVYSDAAGNAGLGGSVSGISFDTLAPLAAASGAPRFDSDTGSSASDLITSVAGQNVSGTLSGPLAAGESVQVSFDDGATWSTAPTSVSGGVTSWSLFHTLTGSGVLRVRVVDAAGNASAAYVANYTLDTIAPTVIMFSSGATVLQGGTATITLSLSDPALLTAADLVVTGGSITGFSGSGSTYTVVVTPPANSTTPITVTLGAGHFSDAAGNSNSATAPLVVAVDTNPPLDPGVPSTVDGLTIHTLSGIDARTGLATRTISVPLVTSSRPEDTSTSHATLADIPIGLAASGSNPATTLVVSLPVGVGFEAAGPSSLLSGGIALTDLIGRIDDHTVAGQATRAAMEAQATRFLDSLDPATQLQHATLTMQADAHAASAVVMINGDENAASGGPNAQHEGTQTPPGATPVDATAIALVVDARALPQGIGLQLDDVDFAAIIGAASVQGGAGKNFIIGDGEAQRIVLSAGADNDIVYGNGGDDLLVTAAGNDELDGGDGADTLAGGAGNDLLTGGAGNDVLQGGRSDTGQWHFFLKDGKVVGQHQMALASATAIETLTAAELNSAVALLRFASGDAARLETLSLLYHAAFDREPDLPGLNFWISHPELSTGQLAAGFLMPLEATQTLAPLNNHDYVARLLENALGVKPSEAALAPWIARLDAAAAGDLTARAGVLADIALSSEHRAAWLSADGMALGSELLTQEQGWIGRSGDDRLSGGAGSDRLVGGDGTDTVVYSGAAAGYMLSLSTHGEVAIVEPDGAHDTIVQIEQGEFNGATVDLGFTQASAATLQEVGMLYHLSLGRAGDLSGFRFWVDSGLHGSALVNSFLAAPEFVQRYVGMDDVSFINQLYLNTVQHGATADQLTQWDTYLDSHSRADLVSLLAGDATLVGSQYGPDGLSLIGNL